MIELVPHMSCIVMEQEFEQALLSNHQEIYVITPKGVLKHNKLKGGRHVRIKVNEIPGFAPKDTLEEEVKFLPNGKVPFHLLEEIVQFFKDVMSIKKAEQEAMAHILWNEEHKDTPDRGYRIGIPDQVVSKASAEYKFTHIKKNDVIVVDLHSHNTMGAFFSGTDDRDDRIAINYAGVVGKLDEREPAFVWRLNINKDRKTVLMTDIFDVPEKKIAIPKDWMDKVEVKTHTMYRGPTHGQGQGTWIQEKGGAWVFRQPQHQGKKNKHKNKEVVRFTESDEERAMNFLEHMQSPELWADLHSESPGVSGFEKVYTSEGPSDRDILDFNTAKGQNNASVHPGRFEDEEADGLGFASEDFDEHAVNYGLEVAEAYDQILEWLDDISDQDKLLLKIISAAYERMTSDGQGKLAESGL